MNDIVKTTHASSIKIAVMLINIHCEQEIKHSVLIIVL